MNEIIFNYFYSFAHKSSLLDFVIVFIAEWYGLIILALLFFYLYKHRDDLKKGVGDILVVGITAVAAWFIAHFFKDVFHTLRPFDVLSWVDPLIYKTGFAFPSGHATFFMALASVLWYYHKYLGLFFGFSAVIIGIARVSAGVHWPLDIVGGWILGAMISIVAHKVLSSKFFVRQIS